MSYKACKNFALIALFFYTTVVLASDDYTKVHTPQKTDFPEPSIENGAKVFAQSCTLCHGPQGLGEGILALKIKDYPNTNLSVLKADKSKDDIFRAIAYGGVLDEYSDYMPPFGASLSWVQIESVALFVERLRDDPKKGAKLIAENMQTDNQDVNLLKIGQQIYSTRCVLCHGDFGEGDGRMSKVIKTPPPYDLTSSRMPDEYLRQIITKGGEALGRSKQMPPWGDQLTPTDINAVIEHLKRIRD